jgi:hypothetical protein
MDAKQHLGHGQTRATLRSLTTAVMSQSKRMDRGRPGSVPGPLNWWESRSRTP